MSGKRWWVIVGGGVLIAALVGWALSQRGRLQAPPAAEQTADPTAARLEALKENEEVLAYLKTYETIQVLCGRLKLPAKMEIGFVPNDKARKVLEAANGDYAGAQLPYIAEREKLLKEHREAFAASPRPDDAALADLLKTGAKRLEERDARNRKLSEETIAEYRKLSAEIERIVKTKDEVPGKEFEDILNRFSGILHEQILIDLRWQTKQVLLHWADPVKYPDDAVPTADLLDSSKVRKR